MILFINVVITDFKRFSHTYPRYGLANYNKIDVFKYALASYSTVNWSKIIIYCQLQDNYQNRWLELKNYINSIFPQNITSLYQYRNRSLKDWTNASKEVESTRDETIFFMCNHDHILIDYDLSMLYEAEKKLVEIKSPASCFFSHWPEAVRFAAEARAIDWDRFLKFTWVNSDSMQLINKALFFKWWSNAPLIDKNLTRTDGIFKFPITTIVPKREIIRHFDGYGHSMHVPGSCPPLEIPIGFWINDIKIAYCYFNKIPNYINIHPFKVLKTVCPQNGVDYNYMLEDIPLFWRDKISIYSQHTKVNSKSITEKRNENILKSVVNPITYSNRINWPLIDQERYWPAMRKSQIKLI